MNMDYIWIYEQTISQMKQFLITSTVALLIVISSPLTIVYLLHYTAKVIAKGLTEDGKYAPTTRTKW